MLQLFMNSLAIIKKFILEYHYYVPGRQLGLMFMRDREAKVKRIFWQSIVSRVRKHMKPGIG